MSPTSQLIPEAVSFECPQQPMLFSTYSLLAEDESHIQNNKQKLGTASVGDSVYSLLQASKCKILPTDQNLSRLLDIIKQDAPCYALYNNQAIPEINNVEGCNPLVTTDNYKFRNNTCVSQNAGYFINNESLLRTQSKSCQHSRSYMS